MRCNLKLNRLNDAAIVAQKAKEYGLSADDTRRRLVAESVEFELQKTAICIDILGDQAHMLSKSVRLAANDPRVSVPSRDSIKAFLAGRFFPGQKYASISDNPILNDVANEFEQYFHTNMPEIDLAWTSLFTFNDLRNSSHDHFDVIDTNAGIVFESISENGQVNVRRQVSESKTSCSMVTYGAGLGLSDEWLEDQKFWNVNNAVAEFNAQYWDKLASIHYGLFTALGAGVNTAFATNDTTTFNNAAAAILRAVRSKGYAVGGNAAFTIVCAPEKLGRILAMLESTQGSFYLASQTNGQPIAYRVAQVIATTHVTSGDTGYYLVLPGRKIQRGAKRDLRIESKRDIYKSATDWVGTTRFNGIIGDSDQVRRVLYA